MVSSEPAVPLGARQHRVSAGTTSARVLAGSAEAGLAVRRQTTTREARILITLARPGGPVTHPRGAFAARVRLAAAGYDLKERSNGDHGRWGLISARTAAASWVWTRQAV